MLSIVQFFLTFPLFYNFFYSSYFSVHPLFIFIILKGILRYYYSHAREGSWRKSHYMLLRFLRFLLRCYMLGRLIIGLKFIRMGKWGLMWGNFKSRSKNIFMTTLKYFRMLDLCSALKNIILKEFKFNGMKSYCLNNGI